MIGMAVIAIAILLVLLLIAGIGFALWIGAFLILFQIFPRNTPKPLRIIAGGYFVLFGAVLTFFSYQFSTSIGLILTAAIPVLFGAGLIRMNAPNSRR